MAATGPPLHSSTNSVHPSRAGMLYPFLLQPSIGYGAIHRTRTVTHVSYRAHGGTVCWAARVPVGCDECLFSLADSPEPMVAQNRILLVPMTPAHTVTHGGPPPISSGMDKLVGGTSSTRMVLSNKLSSWHPALPSPP